MRLSCIIVLCATSVPGHADWRAEVVEHLEAGEVAAAIERAERGRIPWLAPHLVRGLPPPEHYIGWVLTDDTVVAYRPGGEPGAWTWPRPDSLDRALIAVHTALAEARAPDAGDIETLRAVLIEPLADTLVVSPRWLFATDGVLSQVPFALLTDRIVVHALSLRSAALSSLRVRSARARPPSLFAYARAAGDDPRALPAARAEVALAAAALDAPATVLAGPDALARLRIAAYDGTLSGARYVLFAAHTTYDPATRGPATHDPDAPGVIRLELSHDEQARYAPVDTVHLQFSAELVVLSACETAIAGGGSVEGFAHAGVLAGVGMTLLTRWRIDDAAAAQFVAALFAELARGREVPAALAKVQRDFALGVHGDAYAHPFFWAGWQLWGG